MRIRVKTGMMNSPSLRHLVYTFVRDQTGGSFYLEIKDPEHIEYFKEMNDTFEIEGIKEKIKNIVLPKKQEIKEEPEKKYTGTELEELGMDKIRDIGNEIGAKARSKKQLIKEILDIQEGRKEPEF